MWNPFKKLYALSEDNYTDVVVTCGRCGGDRKVESKKKKNKMRNCPHCGGTGKVYIKVPKRYVSANYDWTESYKGE